MAAPSISICRRTRWRRDAVCKRVSSRTVPSLFASRKWKRSELIVRLFVHRGRNARRVHRNAFASLWNFSGIADGAGMNERRKLCRAASNGGASEGGTIHGASSGGESGRANRCGANGGGIAGLNRSDASERRIDSGGASDGADGSESSSWPNSASGCRAIERVGCGGIGGRGAFRIFSREEPLSHSRLHFGLDPLLKDFVQLLAQIGGPVQAGEMEGLDGSFGRSAEIFERPVDGVLLRRRALLCIPLGARHWL